VPKVFSEQIYQLHWLIDTLICIDNHILANGQLSGRDMTITMLYALMVLRIPTCTVQKQNFILRYNSSSEKKEQIIRIKRERQ